MAGATHPPVTAIVLNWNGWPDTLCCLNALHASDYAPLRIIVVDNGSTDGSPEQMATAIAALDATLIVHEENRGFTGGVNAGLRLALESDAAYLFLLNNDATLATDCLARLVDALERCPEPGLAGPRILWAEEPQRVWSGGMSVVWPRARVVAHRDAPDSALFATRRLVQGLSGCALLVRRAVVERVGLLDDRYFAYYEDLDWCLRARRHGFRALYVGDAVALHAGSASTRDSGRSQPTIINYYGARNALLFMATHAPRELRPLALLSLSAALLAASGRIAVGGLLLRRPHAARRAGAIVAGVRDALRGRYGAYLERH